MNTQYLVILGTVAVILIFIIIKKLRSVDKTDFGKVEMGDFEVLEIQLSRDTEEKGEAQAPALLVENMFSALHGLLRSDPTVQEHFSFEIAASGDTGVRFYVAVPRNIMKFVESQIYAQLPDSRIEVVTDYTKELLPTKENYQTSLLKLGKPSFFPIRSFREFEVDPLASLIASISSLSVDEKVWIQVVVRPLADVWQKEGMTYVNTIREGRVYGSNPSPVGTAVGALKKEFGAILIGALIGLISPPKSEFESGKGAPKPVLPPRLSASQELDLRAIENKLSRMGFYVSVRVLASCGSNEKVDSRLRAVLASLNQFSIANLNGFVAEIDKDHAQSFRDYTNRVISYPESFILSTEELASVYHYPSGSFEAPNISWVYSKSSEPPSNLPTEDCVYIGETMFRNKKVKFGIKNGDDRLRHMYLIGKSGTGKSTLIYTMACQDIKNGAGGGVLDPHGETIESILERIPDNRIDDVVIVDPSDSERPVGLNLLEMEDPSQKNLMASGLVAAIKQHFEYSWGPRLEYLLNYAILTLLDVPGTSILGITRLLEDQNYQRYILHQVKDPVVVRFWEKEYKEIKGNQKFATEAIAPIQNKVNRFLASSTIRDILGQKNSTINIWDIMNSGKILLINLSKGKIGSDNANLLGALLVSRIQFYALQRARIPYEKRTPFYLYVDEFQNFASGSFGEILSESRKYKLGLYLTHQYTEQLPEELLHAVYGNVGTLLAFSLGAPDAKALEHEFAPYFTQEDILSLERFQVYIKLMIDGMTSHPFSGRILIPWSDELLGTMIPKTPNRERVLELSRQKYGSDRATVEAKIGKWVETPFDKGMAIAQEKRTPDMVK